MTAIMKMLFSVMKIVFLICWKLLKILCAPMINNLKDLGKTIWKAIKESYKKRKEAKAAVAERADKDSDGGKSASSDGGEEHH